MNTKTFAALLMMLGGIVAVQAQEYQSQSTVFGPGYRITTYEDGSTSTRTWHISARTGLPTDIQDTNTHATPVVAPTPRPFVPDFVDTSYNHDGRAFENLPKAAAPVNHSSVTVIAGPMTPEQIDALMNGKKQ